MNECHFETWATWNIDTCIDADRASRIQIPPESEGKTAGRVFIQLCMSFIRSKILTQAWGSPNGICTVGAYRPMLAEFSPDKVSTIQWWPIVKLFSCFTKVLSGSKCFPAESYNIRWGVWELVLVLVGFYLVRFSDWLESRVGTHYSCRVLNNFYMPAESQSMRSAEGRRESLYYSPFQWVGHVARCLCIPSWCCKPLNLSMFCNPWCSFFRIVNEHTHPPYKESNQPCLWSINENLN